MNFCKRVRGDGRTQTCSDEVVPSFSIFTSLCGLASLISSTIERALPALRSTDRRAFSFLVLVFISSKLPNRTLPQRFPLPATSRHPRHVLPQLLLFVRIRRTRPRLVRAAGTRPTFCNTCATSAIRTDSRSAPSFASRARGPLRRHRIASRLSRPPGLAAYRHRIAPRYGKFVETLHFDKIDGDSDLQAVLLLSPFFSRLNKIIVKRPGLSNVLATGLLQQDHLSECSFMTEPGGNDPLGLPSLFANVTSLDLEMDERMCFMRAIQATRGLHSLHLRGDLAEFNYSISMQTLLLPKLFADMTQLETLKWTGVRVSTFKAFCSSDDDWKGGLPRLRHITIGFDGLLQDTLEFVSMFADSLEHLVLEFTENSTARKEMPTWKLPRLKILEMKGQNGEALRTFACSIYEWTYPALERLHVCPIALFDDDEDLTVRFLEEQITDHDSRTPSNPLRFIQIWDASFPLNSSWQRHIRTVLARHNRQVSTTPMEPYPDSFFLHAELRRYDEKRGRSGQDKIAQLDRVFEFLGDWYTRAKTTRNDADLARQAVILERAELERVVRTGG
ncbi:hypothetical protein NBRC10512_000116 [Rhodotorula toruloides]|uniref:Proteophosphoglycan ppg4 n=1 Tax=Rhodotorula toruloides (strain NP11) TaxID=1130832 RepID=M7XJB6_RHOT1|nr:uncharacterized protein RHTO_03479 [Rhodotorula toruloides NP11]EMS20243.1 hypothetical protein RHTO_03479 [Rhodotorula toruloides NP11]